MKKISEEKWQQYLQDGYLRLGCVVDALTIESLRTRIDEIMLGEAEVDYGSMLMQLDSETGAYGDLNFQGSGHQGATLNYRKIQDLELDPLFLSYLQQPLFEDICRRAYGHDADVDVFRAMFMNKPAGRGTVLPWHQDRWNYFDRDPEVTLWTALDPATKENGCVEVIPGSHRALINPDHTSGFLTPEQAMEHCAEDKRVHLELEVGEVVLLHNWLLHGSNINASQQSRRAFSVCYMDANTKTIDPRHQGHYRRAFGKGALRMELEESSTAV